MSYAMEDTGADAMMPSAQPASIGHGTRYRITRSGARPITFSGSELGMAMSFMPECPYWYEINLYRTTESDFVLAIRLFHQSEEKEDTVEAWRFDSIEDALWQIESYDAARDVEFHPPAAGTPECPAALYEMALSLRAQIAAARQHYASLAGEFLHDIEKAA